MHICLYIYGHGQMETILSACVRILAYMVVNGLNPSSALVGIKSTENIHLAYYSTSVNDKIMTPVDK